MRSSPWRSIMPLALSVMVGFGTLFFGFSVYLTTGAAGGEFSVGLLSIAYGGSVLVGGLLAFPLGRWADRSGVRAIVGLGALLGSAGLVAFAAALEPWQVVAAWWLLVGPASAMILYEPAYLAIDQWCAPDQRPAALAVLTLVGGLAGVAFLPGIARLVTLWGWRHAVTALGGLLLVVGGTTALFAIPPRFPVSRRAEEDASPFSIRRLSADRRFLFYTAAMMLTFAAAQALISQRVARFEEAGFAVSAVAAWAAAASLLSLPGRWLLPHVAHRSTTTTVQAAATVVITISAALTIAGRTSWEMVGHFVLFGTAFGALAPLRAMAMADWYSGARYGRTMGVQRTFIAVAGAAGPAAVGILHDRTAGYAAPMVLVTGAVAVAGLLLLLAGRAAPPQAARRR